MLFGNNFAFLLCIITFNICTRLHNMNIEMVLHPRYTRNLGIYFISIMQP